MYAYTIVDNKVFIIDLSVYTWKRSVIFIPCRQDKNILKDSNNTEKICIIFTKKDTQLNHTDE